MRHLISLVLCLMVATVCLAQTGEFREPWKSENAALVLDPFEGNSIDFDKLATEPRVVAMIHRATIGGRKDTKYAARRDEAKRRRYKWGSYHLGKPGDPVAQADFYLATVRPGDDEVMALDIESLNASTDMSLANARRFLLRVQEKTGRLPILYGNDAVIRKISTSFGRDEVFSKTRLWYARFRQEIPNFPRGTGETYTLWQFSSEINCTPARPDACLIRVPGTKMDMDVNVFHGTVDELKAQWPFKNPV
jgi:lysozyme